MLIEIIIFLITFLIAYYVYVHKRIHYHFEKNGVKYIPGIPIFGNAAASMFLKKHVLEDIDAVYRAFPDEKYVGFIESTTPIILIRDPELIKNITVKDFDHFMNHKEFVTEEIEPLFGGSLLMMKDHLSEEIDVDQLMRRYTNDVIASAGFGLQVNSLKNKDNEFYKTGQDLFNFTGWRRALFFFSLQFPNIAKKLGVTLFPKKTTQFFRDVVSSTMKYRAENNVERPDMIQLLMEASKGTLNNNEDKTEEESIGFATVDEVLKPRENARKWTQDELASQVFIFFVAGFESSANGLVMCVHELALNPEVQDKLYQEIKNFKESKGNLNYDNIGDLKYLDAVLNETSRKWAAALIMDRVCTKTYELPPPREGAKPYVIKPGDIVYNMVNSLHTDPQYFPEPDIFDPDRFSDENKHKIRPFTFMPFGVGPRNCIGSRFALLELKFMIYNLVLNFNIVKCEKTTDPIRLTPTDFNIKAAGGTWVKLLARN